MHVDRRDIDVAVATVNDDVTIPEAMLDRMAHAINRADEAYWQIIADEFPEIKTGDVSPEWVWRRSHTLAVDLVSWVVGNLPASLTAKQLKEQEAEEAIARQSDECHRGERGYVVDLGDGRVRTNVAAVQQRRWA